METVKTKSLIQGKINVDADIEKINQHTVKPLAVDEVYVFPIEVCDNDVDRVGDKMGDTFLQSVADNIAGLTGLKDHDWSSDNQMARLYDAELVEDPTKKNRLGENRKYVLGKAYTLSKYKDYIEKINAGLLKESSLSFKSVNDRCSICGKPMIKDANDIGHCENGHVAGEVYDGVLCYNDINELDDLMEWSLVAVPCQKHAGIKNKKLGGNTPMKKVELLLKQLVSSKGLDEETKEAIEEAVGQSDEELSPEEVQKIVDENIKLQEEVKSLKAKMKELEDGHTREKITDIVSKSVDELGPITPKVKEMIMKELPIDDLKLEDGQIPGLDDVFAGIKESYKGLIKDEETEEKAEEDKVVEDEENTEAEAEAKEADEEEVTSKESEEETSDDQTEKGCGDSEAVNKSVSKKGLQFTGSHVSVSTSNNKSVQQAPSVRSGIVFN